MKLRQAKILWANGDASVAPLTKHVKVMDMAQPETELEHRLYPYSHGAAMMRWRDEAEFADLLFVFFMLTARHGVDPKEVESEFEEKIDGFKDGLDAMASRSLLN